MPNTNAFISYAREDAAFAHALDDALTGRGICVLIDRSAIAPAEEFERRLDSMILEADAVVFLMSPASLASRYCKWEVARAEELQKRIIPVVWRDFDDTGYRPPEGLRKRNWIFFNAFERLGPGASINSPAFIESFEKVVAAITIDIDWQRAHTRHIARAELWHARERPESDFLLSGAEINGAQAWANRKPATESIPDLFFDHLDASLAKAARDLEELNARERRIAARTQQLIAMESQRALDTGMHGRAMRLALAGEPTADELKRGIRAEPVLRAVLAAAAQESPCRLVLQHPASVSFSAFAANSTRIVTACSDNQVRLWDAATGAQVAAWEHDGHINEVAIAEAAGHVATACRDGSTRVWSFGSDVPPRIFRHTDAVTCVAFSPDGKRLVSGSFDTFAIVWDVAAGDIVARFKHGEDLHSVQFSADSSMVLTASSDKFARLWSIESQAELRRFPHGNDRVYRALFSADGRRIATASEDSTAAVWDAATGERLAVLRHDYPVNAVAFSPDVSRIVTGSYDRTAKLWDGQTAKEITRLEHDDEVKHIAFSPDGAFVLTTAGDHTARLWSSATGDEMARFRHTESVAFGSFSDDGHTLVTASLDGTARVWQRGATAEIARVPWSIASTQVSESKPGAGNRNSGTRTIKDPGPDPKTIIVRNVADNQPVFELPHRFEVTGALFSPEGSRIATLSDDKIVRMWDAESGRPLLQLAHPEEVANVVFSADGTRLLTWTLVHGFGQRDVARLWDVETGVLRTRFDNGDVRSAEFGADGATLITHSDDGWSRTWDATFTVRLRGEALVRAVARDRLRGESRLTEEEVLILRPILGDKIERDVVGRWLGSSEYDAEIMTSLDQWRHNSQMAQKLITHA